MIENIFVIAQIILSLAVTILILIQARGTGMSRAFGGNGVSFTRRGVEQVVFKSTFVITGLFVVISAISIIL
jgi:protein translocase SecG subunit